MNFAGPYVKDLASVLFFMLISTCFSLLVPYLSKVFIDIVFKPDAVTLKYSHASWLLPAILVLFLSYGLQIFSSGFFQWLSGKTGHRTVHDIRVMVFSKLQDLSLSYFDKHTTGGLVSRVNQDTDDVQFLIVEFLPLAIQSLLMLVGVCVFLCILSVNITVYVVLPVIALTIFGRHMLKNVHSYFNTYFAQRSRLSEFASDSLSGIRVVKAFGRENKEIATFQKHSSTYRNTGIKVMKLWGVYHPLMQFFIMSGTVFVWAFGGKMILENKMTLGSVVAYGGYCAMFFSPLLTLVGMLRNISTSLSAAQRIFNVLDESQEIRDNPNAVEIKVWEGSIEFRNVEFGYDSKKPVIKNLSFSIAPKEKIGLVGRSGAGKSTIINLLCRFYDVDKGEIVIDGLDVRLLRKQDIHKNIGVVLQETFLFNGTIYENIAYAKPEATHAEVIDASIAAFAHDFICKKPDAYDSLVGERGVNLSGGEKQRIAIARALLLDPAILILDEALSSVDSETEIKIKTALDNLTKNRTTIAIAHRISTLQGYDRIFVIENGHCIESGTPLDLFDKKGAFYKMVSMTRSKSFFNEELSGSGLLS